MTQNFGYRYGQRYVNHEIGNLLTFTFLSNIIHGKQDGKLKQGNSNKSSHIIFAFLIVLILWYIPACLKSKQ